MRMPAAQRRSQLLETAVHVFAEHGYHATSMNDVAETAGVTKPVLYQHFSSKRELFVEVLTDVGNELRDTITKATSDAAGPREQVHNGLRAYFHFVEDRSDSFRVLFGSGARRDPEFASFARSVEETIAEMIAELIVVDGQPAEHRDVLAHGIVGMAEASSRHWLSHEREPDVDTLASQVAGLAWSGMRGLDR